jgi:hypothetical protein
MPTATTRTSFDKGLKQRDLLYVSNANGTVSVYRYWQRTLVTVLTQFTRPLRRVRGWGYVQGVAWDGKYWVVQSYDGLYRYAINIKSTYVDMMELSGGDGEAGPVAIYRKDSKAKGTQAVAGTGSNGDSAVEFWNYPAAGNPIHDITQDLDAPFGVAISLGSQE